MRPVLIVEDDESTREFLSALLTLEGFDVVTASNGREGINRLRGEGASVILLDLMMPMMDGWEFRAEQIRDPALAAVPVVVLSAAYNARQSAERIGAAACLPKPFNPDALIEAVQRLLP